MTMKAQFFRFSRQCGCGQWTRETFVNEIIFWAFFCLKKERTFSQSHHFRLYGYVRECVPLGSLRKQFSRQWRQQLFSHITYTQRVPNALLADLFFHYKANNFLLRCWLFVLKVKERDGQRKRRRSQSWHKLFPNSIYIIFIKSIENIMVAWIDNRILIKRQGKLTLHPLQAIGLPSGQRINFLGNGFI